MSLPQMKEHVKGRVYKIKSRNLRYGVYDGNGGFIGIRNKMGNRFLDTELHYDMSRYLGTVQSSEDLGVDVPNGVLLQVILDNPIDQVTGREVEYNITEKKWYFLDTLESSKYIKPRAVENTALFEFLEGIENEHGVDKPTINDGWRTTYPWFKGDSES